MGRSLWTRSQQGLQSRPCLKKVRTKPNKAKDKQRQRSVEWDPELSWGGNLFWKITACYPTCWPLRQEKEKLDAMLTALLSLNLLLGQEQVHQLPKNLRIINWKIFIKHLGGPCHKLGIPGRRLSGSPEPKEKLPEEMDSEEMVSSEKRHGCEWVGTGHGSLLTGGKSMRHAKDLLQGGPVLQNVAAIKSNTESFRWTQHLNSPF